MRALKNKLAIYTSSDTSKAKQLKQGGAAYNKVIKKLKEGKGRKLKSGLVAIRDGKKTRYVERVAGTSLGRPASKAVRRPGRGKAKGLEYFVEKSKAPRTTRAAAKLRAQKKAPEFGQLIFV